MIMYCLYSSEVPISFTNNVDSLEFCTFEKYLLFNKSAPINAKIVETESMHELFDMLLLEERAFLALEGPPGSGKTTSLIWLYSQMKTKYPQNTTCIPAFLTLDIKNTIMQKMERMPTDHPIYIFSDLCDVSEFTKESLNCWSAILCSKMSNRQVVVFALSSGFHLPRVLGFRSNQSLLECLYTGFRKFAITQQTNQVMVQIGLQFGVDTSSDALVKACGIPKLIILGEESAVNAYIKRGLRILIQHGIDKDIISLDDNLRFLIALRYERNVVDLGLALDEAEQTVPVLANLAFLGNNGIPRSYITISDELMKCLIKLLKMKINSVVVEEEAVIGYVFESVCGNTFEDPLSLRIGSSIITVRSMPTAANRVVSGDILVKDTLYRCVKHHVAIDFVAIIDIQGTESLLLIQTSVQASSHVRKLEKALKLTDVSWTLDGVNIPQHVVYLYLNPMATSDSYESRQLAFKGLGNHHSSVFGWEYAEVGDTSRGALDKIYRDAKASVIVCESV